MHTAGDFIMDTIVEQVVFCEDAAAVCESVARLLRRIESRLSFFKPGSDIRMLNDAAGTGAPVPIGADALCVLLAALEYSEKSGGAFDVTAAPLMECWRNAAAMGNDKAPGEDELSAAKNLVGYDGLYVYPENSTAMLAKKGAAVDLGGIAKGYAADLAVGLYMTMGAQAALINLGGNVKTLGKKPDGQPWIVGMQDPDRERGEFFGILRVGEVSAVTSGGYERFSVIGTKKYHHIIDPVSGIPSVSGLISATVIARESMRADALSTAAFILGRERAMELLENYPGTEAVLMDDERRIWLTGGAREVWSPAPGCEQPVYLM